MVYYNIFQLAFKIGISNKIDEMIYFYSSYYYIIITHKNFNFKYVELKV